LSDNFSLWHWLDAVNWMQQPGMQIQRQQISLYTIANLAGSETITAPHVAEALQYRARGDVE
jgi:predicted ATPase with chaperone activity